MDKEILCPFRMVGKVYCEDCRCIGSLCELWLNGYGKCSFRLLAILPYLNDKLEKLLNGLSHKYKKTKK